MRERFFNNHKLNPHRLDYKFFVPVLAVMIISALPAMSANAQQTSSSISSGIQSLEDCVQKFQGSDHIYCDSSFSLNVAKSGQQFSKYRYSSSDTIIVNEKTMVTLSGLRSTDPDSDKLAYTWSQISGDKVSFSSTDPVISFIAPPVPPNEVKSLTIGLTVDDGHGGKAAAMVKVTVKSTHISPTVSCSDISVLANTPVTLYATVSNPSGDVLLYHWKQVSGIPVKLSSRDDLTPTFVSPIPNGVTGQLVFELTIGDDLVSLPACDVVVNVNTIEATGVPPVADAGSDQTVDELTKVSLDGSASKGVHLKYSWEQVSGDKVTLLFSETAQPAIFAPPVPIGETKELVFKLTVTNEYGQDSATVKITVVHTNNNPTAVITPE